MNWMEIFGISLLALAWLTGVELFSRTLADFRRRRLLRRIAILIHALLLTVAAISVFNTPEYFSEELNRALRLERATVSGTALHQSLDKNFLLIDNAEAQVGGITDRGLLIQLLRYCQQKQNLIDLVVTDISFTMPDQAHDATLQTMLDSLAARHRLLAGVQSEYDRLLDRLPAGAKGRITETSSEALFAFHKIYDDKIFSLPYLIYQRTDNIQSERFLGLLIESAKGKSSPFRLNSFMPLLFDSVAKDRHLSEHVMIKGALPLNLFSSTEFLKQMTDSLKARKNAGEKNIIVVGAFSGEQDLHSTTSGQVYGPVILLQLWYELHQGSNVLGIKLLLELLLFFVVFNVLMIYQALQQVDRRRAVHILPQVIRGPWERAQKGLEWRGDYYWIKFLMALVHLLLELGDAFLLIAVLLLIKFSTNVMVNIVSMTAYMLIFKKVLHFFLKRT